MVQRSAKTRAADLADSLPPLPLAAEHWSAVAAALNLSPQQTRIVELTLRGACHKQTATILGISEPTLKSYLQRIFVRTGTRSRMQLAMHVLAVSHQVAPSDRRHPKR